MAVAGNGEAVEREVHVAARPETIFPFLTDATKMLRWMGIAVELDPRPGGVYLVRINSQNVARGHFVEVVSHTRIVFTWGWEGANSAVPPGSTTVEVSLIPDGDGTIVRLRHLGLPAEHRETHGVGWAHYLARLATLAGGGDPGPDPWASAPQG